ncbi:MAG: hypothetical protein AB8B53_05460 [Flavobacteriales bacterium]
MKYLIFFISLFIGFSATGQNSDLVNDALIAYKEGRLQDAQSFIEDALKQPELSESPKVWNFKGHVYKQLYKESTGSSEMYWFRDEAVMAFKRTIELSEKGKYAEDSRKALEYLSATYFNDALKSAASVTYGVDDDPVINFQKFKELKFWLNPNENITREELQFLKMLAQGFEKIHTKSEVPGLDYMEKAVDYYEQALEIDSLDYAANFNLAIVYYNEGAELIGKINYNTGFVELIQIQNSCVKYFTKALPFMERAEAIRPNRVETLKGLMFINRALNNFEKYIEYKVLLEEILKK